MEALDTYKVNLPAFEGPLDLLLYLIRKNDLNIYEIPIAFITEEYLRCLDQMQELNIDLAGEFLVMAAELARIKSRLLLPIEGGDEEEEGQDPAAELARRLLEYQRYKDAAQMLFKRPMIGREVFKHPPEKTIDEMTEVPVESDVYRLIQAFSDTLKRLPKKNFHDVMVDRISVSQRIYQVMELLDKNEALGMEDLLPENLTKFDVVITFLALLEMAKLKMIQVYQEGAFHRLLIRRKVAIAGDDDLTSQSQETEAS